MYAEVFSFPDILFSFPQNQAEKIVYKLENLNWNTTDELISNSPKENLSDYTRKMFYLN